MRKYLKVLSEEEFEKLKDAISLITVYVAGADGNIESEELEWADKVTSIRSYNLPSELKDFYKEVEEDFSERVTNYVKTLDQLEIRNQTVTEKLTELNPILEKLNPRLGAALYASYISFAKHVAKASGGFLGFFSIGPEEKAILDLKMIKPIIWMDENGHPLKID